MPKVQLTILLSFSFLLIVILKSVSVVNASPVDGGRRPPGRGFGRNEDGNTGYDTVRVSLNDDEEIVTVPDVAPNQKTFTVESPKEVFNAKVLDDVNWACLFEQARDWTASSPPSPPSPSSSPTQSGRDDYTVFSRTFSYDADPDARETFDPPFQYTYLICFRLPSPSRVNEEVILLSELSVSGIGTASDIRKFPLPQYGLARNRVHILNNDLSTTFNRVPTLKRSAVVYAPPRAQGVTCYALDRIPIPQTTYVDGVPFSPGNPFVGGLENWLATACEVADY